MIKKKLLSSLLVVSTLGLTATTFAILINKTTFNTDEEKKILNRIASYKWLNNEISRINNDIKNYESAKIYINQNSYNSLLERKKNNIKYYKKLIADKTNAKINEIINNFKINSVYENVEFKHARFLPNVSFPEIDFNDDFLTTLNKYDKTIEAFAEMKSLEDKISIIYPEEFNTLEKYLSISDYINNNLVINMTKNINENLKQNLDKWKSLSIDEQFKNSNSFKDLFADLEIYINTIKTELGKQIDLQENFDTHMLISRIKNAYKFLEDTIQSNNLNNNADLNQTTVDAISESKLIINSFSNLISNSKNIDEKDYKLKLKEIYDSAIRLLNKINHLRSNIVLYVMKNFGFSYLEETMNDQILNDYLQEYKNNYNSFVGLFNVLNYNETSLRELLNTSDKISQYIESYNSTNDIYFNRYDLRKRNLIAKLNAEFIKQQKYTDVISTYFISDFNYYMNYGPDSEKFNVYENNLYKNEELKWSFMSKIFNKYLAIINEMRNEFYFEKLMNEEELLNLKRQFITELNEGIKANILAKSNEMAVEIKTIIEKAIETNDFKTLENEDVLFLKEQLILINECIDRDLILNSIFFNLDLITNEDLLTSEWKLNQENKINQSGFIGSFIPNSNQPIQFISKDGENKTINIKKVWELVKVLQQQI
ncbi:Uncharacterised protein [Metamycoplasma cloacale]|uniref:Uncharacterized protein n=1 Tax=Metamycoplasma cloacale TaxID=92401 RepID=A0A2Z4LLS9_9BACT|nr:hypothetical protein [Metamycoplasma cloacale]AWX42634.1 hypothetical protein DK849_00860 [Metamycoplasma cloacale]VEU79592.1 Uncharacterised protein [Metamycoplasma cloacale]